MAAAQNDAGVLDTVRVAEVNGAVEVTIEMSEPVRYVNHSLSPSGTVLQVRLTRLPAASVLTAEAPGRDRLAPAAAGPVGEITYLAGTGGEGTLLIRFSRPVRVTVRPQAYATSLSLSVSLRDDAPSAVHTATPGRAGAEAQPPAFPIPEPQPTTGPASAEPSPGGRIAPSPAMAGVMEQGRRAMIEGDYALAVGLFTKVVQSGDPAFAQEAQELLGVAQERSNHLAHAKAEYEEYLRLYPTGEGADRVRQRLAVLLTGGREPPSEAGTRAAPASTVVKSLDGSFSQFFRRNSSVFDDQGEIVDQSYLASDLDLSGRLRTDGYELRTQLSGGYRLDIEGSTSNSDLRMRYLYLDATARRQGLSLRLGRQSRSSGGVLGRFDGALLEYRLTERTRLNAVGGFPVELSSSNEIDTDRHFYGVGVDFGPFAEFWSVSGFAIQQVSEGLLDRRAVGGEIRYVRPEVSFFTLVDYDISYLDLNILLMQGTYRFENTATLGIVLDYRETPALTTNNALIGQPVGSLDDLRDLYGKDQVRDLAEDRTQRSTAVTLSGSHPLSQKLQIAADFTVAKLSSTPSSGDVEGTPATGEDYVVSTQMIGSDVLWSGDVQIFGLRYAHSDITDTGSIMINSRTLFAGGWRLNPRLQVDIQSRSGGSKAAILRPAFLVDYRWRRSLTFELEGGYERVEEFAGSTGNSRHGYYVYAGYRWDF